MAISSSLGYPRIGADREWKKAIEAYWAGTIGEEELNERLRGQRLKRLERQRELGVELIPVHDFSYYDHVLDTATMFGLVPARFGFDGDGRVPLSVYYAMARGSKGVPACEMTKWFNTNYHYIVPELDGAEPRLAYNGPLEAYREAKRELGIEGKPVLLGPLTLLKLSKGYALEATDEWLERLLPLYVRLLKELEEEGVRWVQVDEPILVLKLSEDDIRRLRLAYETIAREVPGLNVMLQTYFESVPDYETVVSLPVRGIGLDFAQGREGNLANLQAHGFPADKTLGAGVIDGRGVWRANLSNGRELLERLAGFVSPERLIVQPSCSLLHVPVSKERESHLPEELYRGLSFADEKLGEIAALTRSLAARSGAEPDGDRALREAFAESERALAALQASPARQREDVREALRELRSREPARSLPFAERRKLQQQKLGLPPLPTTTIGSFPQSAEVRKARQLWRKGEWTEERYDEFVRGHIDRWIGIQRELGLDVFVHGEFERTDMVEFFGEKLDGFAFTRYGWVQSYGSRCVKPPILYGDAAYREPMTVKETSYAQSRADRPVKGMLTGPVTILNWSFVREDVTREELAGQLAYALRREVEALEAAGIGIVQVDEPAVREGLPLREEERKPYLDWAVRAFRQTTCTVKDETQIHTHMCYCEFRDMIDSIEAMDADVISLETSRSHGELLASFESRAYPLGIGLGVYDIHSPRVPEQEEMERMIERALKVLDPSLFWINPDCGLKTRGEEETKAALRRMVGAARVARAAFAAAPQA